MNAEASSKETTPSDIKSDNIPERSNNEQYFPSVRSNSSFASKKNVEEQPMNAIDPTLAIPEFLRNSRSNSSNRASVLIERINPTYIPISPRLTAFDETQKPQVVIKKQIEEIRPSDYDNYETGKSDDTQTMFRELENEKKAEESKSEQEENVADSVATISNTRPMPVQIALSEIKVQKIQEATQEVITTPRIDPVIAKSQPVNEPILSRQQSKADVERVESNARAIEMLLEQNTKLHQELEEAKKQIVQLQQTKIKYDYVVTKAYKKVKEIMAENQDLKTDLTRNQTELISLSTKLEAIQSVFGGGSGHPTLSKSPTAVNQLRLKEKLGSEKSLNHLARDT